MALQTSHSSRSRFETCPKSYEFHYIQRLRPNTQSAALLFGSAVDAALTGLFKNGSDPHKTFDEYWMMQKVNKKDTYLAECLEITYANSDFDEELLLERDWEILGLNFNVKDPKAEVQKVYEEKDNVGVDNLPDDRKRILNFANWLCLSRKGHLMIEAVKKEVVPNIEKVLGVQEKVQLENEEGDTVIGYADIIVKWKGIDTPVIFDFKTSSREYKPDSVITSTQLALYTHALEEKFHTRLAGYIVLHKAVRKNKTKTCTICNYVGEGSHKTCDNKIEGKRCNGIWKVVLNPSVYVQIIIGEISKQLESIVLENTEQINNAIKTGIFTRNFDSCVKPWGKCPYFDLCYKGTSSGLCKMEDK